MAKTNLIPKSKAKTAYALLTEIRKLILEEPKRYDQTQWKPLIGRDTDLRPQCGTVCCVAGWVDTLKSPDPVQPGDNCDTSEIGMRAKEILGLRQGAANALFSPHAVNGIPGTKEYARMGAEHIAKFQKRHAEQLKAKRV